jgi:hypothetical protein
MFGYAFAAELAANYVRSTATTMRVGLECVQYESRIDCGVRLATDRALGN